MNCEKAMDRVYGWEGESLLARVSTGLHLFACPDCALKAELLEACGDVLRDGFLPPSPGLEDTIMSAIATETEEAPGTGKTAAATGAFSLRGWVIAGVALLVSLSTIFLGMEFNNVALAGGGSFMIPLGITIGALLTGYGALFIGSHLKELIQRFGL